MQAIAVHSLLTEEGNNSDLFVPIFPLKRAINSIRGHQQLQKAQARKAVAIG